MKEYGAYGCKLIVPADFDLPLPLPPPPPTPRSQIEIVRGLPVGLEKLFPEGFVNHLGRIDYGRVTVSGVLWCGIWVPRVGTYIIEGTTRIWIEALPNVDNAQIAVYLVGFALSFLAHQEHTLVFHGSAVAGHSGALVIVGNQGAGKSTTATALTLHGYPLLCDDSVPVLLPMEDSKPLKGSVNPGHPQVLPGIPRPKLLPDACEKLIGNPEELALHWDGVDKYQIDLGGGGSAAPLAGIVVIDPCSESSAQPSLVTVRGAERITALRPHIQFLAGIDEPLEQVKMLVKIAASAPVFRLIRPLSCDTLDSVTRLLREFLGNPPDAEC